MVGFLIALTCFLLTRRLDLRRPSKTQAALELMLDGSLGKLSDRQMTFVDVGLQNCKLLGRMVSDLLDVYRMEAGHFRGFVRRARIGIRHFFVFE